MQIPIVIVDDEEVDRLLVSKRIARSEWSDVLTPVLESETGDAFLEAFAQPGAMPKGRKLILMDINMPGRNGFETIEELKRVLSDGDIDDDSTFFMFTSSENASDIARANALDMVCGYIVKPFDDKDIETIVSVLGLEKPGSVPDDGMLH